jgi:hypothetical protein
MEERGDRVKFVKFPSTQHGACDNAANRVYPRYSCECFMAVNTLFLSIALDDQSRLARSIGLRLEDPLAADHMLSGRNVFTHNLFPGSVLE